MPQARAKAEEASLPTLVLDGKQALRIRRTQAKGGSNSMAVAAEGVVVDVDVEGVSFLVCVEVDAAAAPVVGVLLLLAGVSLEGVAAVVVVASAMMRVVDLVWMSQRV